jgi:nonsense-mediated mRNA decay protein 3
LCLKKLKNIAKVHLVDATFLYTEPHSKRLKMKVTIQKEVFNGAVLQQVFVVEFVVTNLFCESCHRKEANDFWTAVVQVRQKAAHKKTLFYLEQLIMKYQAHANTVDIKAIAEGIDFYFDRRDDATKFIDFLQSVVPCRYIPSHQLISHDTNSNTYKYKFGYSVEVIPICKDDIVCLPLPLANYLGNIGQVCVCLRITNHVYLIDPFSLKIAELDEQHYFRHPFRSFANSRMLTHFTVMEVEPVDQIEIDPLHVRNYSDKHELADVWVIRSSELGKHENYVHARTHLGGQLSPGDQVLGFDMANSNLNDQNLEKYLEGSKSIMPDVILVKKFFLDRATRRANRKWKLKRMNLEAGSVGTTINNDFADFMEDMEEDPMLRANINIYKDEHKINRVNDELDVDLPTITLEEMLDDTPLLIESQTVKP